MAKHRMSQALPEPQVEYYPAEGILYVSNGKPFGEGETIAKNVVVFYDRENENEVNGICIELGAETVLKPFVDAILAKYGLNPEQQPTVVAAES
jgi:hypothetical protein